MRFFKDIIKYCVIFIAVLAVAGILAFIFRDFLALKYANFFYFEKYPSGFDKDNFTRKSQNLAQNLTRENNLDSAILRDSQNLAQTQNKSQNLTQISRNSQNLVQILRPNSQTIPNSAILILGGGIQSRLFHAIALYRYGISDLVLITNPANYIYNDFGGTIKSEVAQMKGALDFAHARYKIVPSKNPLGAQSTRDEALDVVDFLRQNPLDKIFIITSEFHSKRAYITFSDIFAKEGIKTEIYLFPAPNHIFNRANWHKSELGIACYLLEMPKLLLYYASNSELKGVKAH